MLPKMRSFTLMAASLTFLLGPSIARGACPIERARYRMIHNSGFTAGFEPILRQPMWL